ncbi:MAG: DNA alkylation repair protein [Candidatus Promineifilaceae bacterium]
MADYIKPLVAQMNAASNPEAAAPMAAYMRDQFPFLGLKSAARRAILQAFLAEHGPPDAQDAAGVARALWALPEREHQYNAMDILRRQRSKLDPQFVPHLEWLLTTKSWWDTIDGLAGWVAGALFAAYPAARESAVAAWRGSDNIWLRRTTLLFQLKYKDKTDVPLLFSLIEENRDDNEFFIQKAIGWALREYSKTDEMAVRDFVARTGLSPLAGREALKWLTRQEQRRLKS